MLQNRADAADLAVRRAHYATIRAVPISPAEAVGTTYGCTADKDLVQINFLLQYTYRNQSYYYKAMTFKANGNT